MLCTSCNLVQVITRTTLAVQVKTRTTEPYNQSCTSYNLYNLDIDNHKIFLKMF